MKDKDSGEHLRDKGMKKATDHANDVITDWSSMALLAIQRYPEPRFLTDDRRKWAYANGVPKPPDDRAWGSIVTSARKKGMIVADGFAAVNSPQAHKRPMTVWLKK